MEELAGDGSALRGMKRKLSYDSSHSTDDARDPEVLHLSPTQRGAGNQHGTAQSTRGARLAIRAPKPSADLSSSCSSAAGSAASTTMPQPDVEAGSEFENISLHLEPAEPCTPRAFSCASSIFTPEKEERRRQHQQQLRSWSASAASRSLFMAQMNSPKAALYSCDRASSPTSKKDSPRWMCPPTSIIHRLQAMTPAQRRTDGSALSSASCPYPATPNRSHRSHPGSLDPVAALQQWLQLQVSCSDARMGKQRGQLPVACHEAARQASMHRML